MRAVVIRVFGSMLCSMGAAKTRIEVEIAVQSVADGVAAARAGADRLEFSAALEVGGLTPSLTALMELRRVYDGPIVALVRPRAGGFCYDDAEFDGLLREMEAVVKHGADAVAAGVLCEDGTIDRRRCAKLRREADGVALVFHRAFDLTPDPLAALDVLIEIGFTRVLTSGGQRWVGPPSPGAEVIRRLIARAAGRIGIVAAGGIRAVNAAALIRATGCAELHAACTRARIDGSAGRPHDAFGFGIDGQDGAYLSVDEEQVAALRRVVDAAAMME